MVSGVSTTQVEALPSRQNLRPDKLNLNKTKMAHSEEMQVMIMQAAFQAATAAVGAMRETDLSAKQHSRRSIPEEKHRPRKARPMLNQPAFNLKAPDRYVELLNFEMQVANVPKTKVYDLNEEE